MIFGLLALTFAALFAGAAFYINFAEQPARLLLDANSLLKQWGPSYKRGFIMQATLAVLSGISGIVMYFHAQNWIWILGSIIILSNWPYTLLVIMPTNRKILATKEGSASAEEVRKINYWGKLHAIRTYLGILAVIIFLTAHFC